MAQVKIEAAEVFGAPAGCTTWLPAKVVEAFKGKLAADSSVEFYTVAGTGFKAKDFVGEKIVFLERYANQNGGSTRLETLKNSSRSARADCLRFFRKLKAKPTNRR